MPALHDPLANTLVEGPALPRILDRNQRTLPAASQSDYPVGRLLHHLRTTIHCLHSGLQLNHHDGSSRPKHHVLRPPGHLRHLRQVASSQAIPESRKMGLHPQSLFPRVGDHHWDFLLFSRGIASRGWLDELYFGCVIYPFAFDFGSLVGSEAYV